ncbi:hypothetical protein CN692_07400 [Bacillus sp. AFS002410]|uniref:DUF2187 family protein n=1 Tax=Bacillus sp. AFS002410 TaxID=2033481 RepID=UPI000BF16206|nr:DUF2187 family protein [Bacillus sp. AFS002410]PEJ58795.1 hypothetical protein CN692_07400 [Bacillus sp. AFS002410]
MCENNKTIITMNKYYVKPGDEIEFTPKKNDFDKKNPNSVKGIVTKVLSNSVIVDMRKDRNHRNYYDHDHTVINHNKYKILANMTSR